MKTAVKIFSCYWETYRPLVQDILDNLCRKTDFAYDKDNLSIEKIQLEGNTIAAQRNKNSRSILIYTNDELRYIIAVSNTNYDEDKLLEANKLNKTYEYGKSNYHANTYFLQGINNNFDLYYEQKQKFPDVQMLFYALDLEGSHPHNNTNIMLYRKLATIGFQLLNLDDIKGITPKRKAHMEYSSLNSFINNILDVSSRNKSNMPAYIKVIDNNFDIMNDDEDSDYESDEKYIYTFKSLGAQAYDSFLTIWTLVVLAKREHKTLEFKFAEEKYNFTDPEHIKKTTGLMSTIKTALKNAGITIEYETSEEVLQQEEREHAQYQKAKNNSSLRNQELFKNNMRTKGMPTRCCLCGCEVEEILEAAHIWGVSDIKSTHHAEIKKTASHEDMRDLFDEDIDSFTQDDDFYLRYKMANSGDNGIWLCKNHHGMFDRHFYCFDTEEGKVIVDLNKMPEDSAVKEFFDSITSSQQLDRSILTNKTKLFISKNQI